MPALIGGFFRRGHLVAVCNTTSNTKTPVSSTAKGKVTQANHVCDELTNKIQSSSKESGLKAAIKSNEVWS